MIVNVSSGTSEFRKPLEMKCGLGMIVFSVDEDSEVQRVHAAGKGLREHGFPELTSHPCLVCWREHLHLAR